MRILNQEAIELWDEMEGELPSFKDFLIAYLKARWETFVS